MGRGNALHWPPVGSPAGLLRSEDDLKHFDNSVNAVSFGFVATALLVSMFFAMAIFERIFRRDSAAAAGRRTGTDSSQINFDGKVLPPPPTMLVLSKEVSVVMPGENTPTFIANPVPIACATQVSVQNNNKNGEDK